MWHVVVWHDANGVRQEDRFTDRVAAHKAAAALAYYKIKAHVQHNRPALRGPAPAMRCIVR